MPAFRFQVDMTMCFTINHEDEATAKQLANQFAESFVDGADIGPNMGEFDDADARVYYDATDNDPEIVDIEDDGRRFLVKDRSGRGESVTLDAAELLSTFPMEVEFESGEPEEDEFSEWIDSAEVGDTFDHPDHAVKITRTE